MILTNYYPSSGCAERVYRPNQGERGASSTMRDTRIARHKKPPYRVWFFAGRRQISPGSGNFLAAAARHPFVAFLVWFFPKRATQDDLNAFRIPRKELAIRDVSRAVLARAIEFSTLSIFSALDAIPHWISDETHQSYNPTNRLSRVRAGNCSRWR